MTQQQNKWSADAEMSMQGFVIPVENREHLRFMVRYCLKVLKSDVYRTDDTLDKRTDEIMENAINRYNTNKTKAVYQFTVNSHKYGGVLMTFVRTSGKIVLKSGKMRPSGVLAWSENIDAPQNSELGYVFFDTVRGKVRRVA